MTMRSRQANCPENAPCSDGLLQTAAGQKVTSNVTQIDRQHLTAGGCSIRLPPGESRTSNAMKHARYRPSNIEAYKVLVQLE